MYWFGRLNNPWQVTQAYTMAKTDGFSKHVCRQRQGGVSAVPLACVITVLASVSPGAVAAQHVADALRHFYRSVDPNASEVLTTQGWIQKLKTALELSPRTREGAEAAFVIGELWCRAGKTSRGLLWFRKAVSYRPAGQAWVILSALKRIAQIHIARREWTEALGTLTAFEAKCGDLSAKERQNGYVQRHLHYLSILPIKKAKCLWGQGQTKQATGLIQRYVASIESGDRDVPPEYEGLGFDAARTLLRLAGDYSKLGDRRSAVAVYDRILAKYPDSLDAAMVACRRMRALGLTDDKELQEISRIVSAYPQAMYSFELLDRLIVRHAKLQRPVSVIHWAQVLLARLDKLPPKVAAKKAFLRRSALLLMAEAYGALSDYGRARECFGRLAQEYPAEANRANARLAASRMNEALTTITRLQQLAPK